MGWTFDMRSGWYAAILAAGVALAPVAARAGDGAGAGFAPYRADTRLSVGKGDVPAVDLLDRMAQAFELKLTVLPSVAKGEAVIHLSTDADLDFESLRAVLKGHGVALVHEPGPEGSLWLAMLERDVYERYAATSTPVLQDGEPLPHGATLVTLVVPLHRVDPNAAFAVLRQLVSRSFGKVGQIFYVADTRSLTLRDFAEHVAYYRSVIVGLEAAAAARPTVEVAARAYWVDAGSWERARAGEPAADIVLERLEAMVRSGEVAVDQASLLVAPSFRVPAGEAVRARMRDHALVEGGRRVSAQVSATPEPAGNGRFQVRLRTEVTMASEAGEAGGADGDAGRRPERNLETILDLRAGEWGIVITEGGVPFVVWFVRVQEAE